MRARRTHPGSRLRVVPRRRGPVLPLGRQRPRLRVHPRADAPSSTSLSSFLFTKPHGRRHGAHASSSRRAAGWTGISARPARARAPSTLRTSSDSGTGPSRRRPRTGRSPDVAPGFDRALAVQRRGAPTTSSAKRRRSGTPSSAVFLILAVVGLLRPRAQPRHRVQGRVRVPRAEHDRHGRGGPRLRRGRRHRGPRGASRSAPTSIRIQTQALTVDAVPRRRRPALQGPRRSGERASACRFVGPSWGARDHHEGAARAGRSSLSCVMVFLSLYFEWKMAVAAIIALLHDLVITARHLRADRLRGDAGHGHRLADDPRLLAVRHRRRVRQGPGEHRAASPAATG